MFDTRPDDIFAFFNSVVANARSDRLMARCRPWLQGGLPYAASQGWMIIQDDVVTLTTAGLRAA